ncbi:hypothetical protein [Fusibacillus kribbianus]|uniref:Uncharacterized protein n=1 Tax=Fusibacillus kribbianus TaxID=3044208 RepID=A0AAP4B9V9_9FIRM|nr:hypothetical protein [Ruminococcus sp. YH-rum2234]MDI9241907.1 hypothetical protein [Ruminococcus sp. YH-rum2234]
MKQQEETGAAGSDLIKEYRAETKDRLPDFPDRIRTDGKIYQYIDTEYEEIYEDKSEEVTLTEETVLESDDISQVPRTITRDGIEYKLDEASVTVTVSRSETITGTDILEEYVTYTLPDNDIERLTKQITKDGKTLDLISVEYSVTKATESGVPTEYAARCRYATNIEYEEENPVEWTATATYAGTKTEKVLKEVVARCTYELVGTEASIVQEPSVLPAVIVGGATGAVLIGAFFVFFFFRRRKNTVELYVRGNKKPIHMGHIYAKKKNGVWEFKIPTDFTTIPIVSKESILLKPSKGILKSKIRQARIVSPYGVFFTEIEAEMGVKNKS